MKNSITLQNMARTEQGKFLLQDMLDARDLITSAMSSSDISDSMMRFMSGRLSMINDIIKQLQDKR